MTEPKSYVVVSFVPGLDYTIDRGGINLSDKAETEALIKLIDETEVVPTGCVWGVHDGTINVILVVDKG